MSDFSSPFYSHFLSSHRSYSLELKRFGVFVPRLFLYPNQIPFKSGWSCVAVRFLLDFQRCWHTQYRSFSTSSRKLHLNSYFSRVSILVPVIFFFFLFTMWNRYYFSFLLGYGHNDYENPWANSKLKSRAVR